MGSDQTFLNGHEIWLYIRCRISHTYVYILYIFRNNYYYYYLSSLNPISIESYAFNAHLLCLNIQYTPTSFICSSLNFLFFWKVVDLDFDSIDYDKQTVGMIIFTITLCYVLIQLVNWMNGLNRKWPGCECTDKLVKYALLVWRSCNSVKEGNY